MAGSVSKFYLVSVWCQ